MADQSLVKRNEEFEFDWRLAQVAAKSGLYPDVRQNSEAAMAKILLGRSLGLEATQALIGIHMVEGKPMVAAVTLASFVRKHPVHDFRVLVGPTDTECVIEFGPKPAPGKDENGEWLPWPEAYGISEFTIEKARRAGLVKERGNWVKWPENMNYSRAMSNGVKWFCSDATQGIPVYHEGEIEPLRAVDGVIDGSDAEYDSVSLSAVAEEVPADLRDRFYAAYGEAMDLRRRVSLLVARMAVVSQPPERVEEFIATMERANAEARVAAQDEDVEDADIVPEDDPSTDDTQAGEESASAGTAGVDYPAPIPLDQQLADLYDLRREVEEQPGDLAETEAELDRIGAEIARLERERDTAQDTSQGSLP